MSDNATCEVCYFMAVTLMINLRSILCRVSAYSNKLCVLLEPHSSFRFQYRLLSMTAFFEIAVYIERERDRQTDRQTDRYNRIEQCALPVTTIMALWQLVNLGTPCTVTHCRVALWSHQSTQTASSERSINANE